MPADRFENSADKRHTWTTRKLLASRTDRGSISLQPINFSQISSRKPRLRRELEPLLHSSRSITPRKVAVCLGGESDRQLGFRQQQSRENPLGSLTDLKPVVCLFRYELLHLLPFDVAGKSLGNSVQ